jgi:8-oxo-dGTP pyrophosphatase MutT (NUDIX family)
MGPVARRPSKWPVETRLLFASPWMRIREDDIRGADGDMGRFAVVSRADFVVVICVADGRLVMTEQYRYAAARWSLELPQGGLEPRESPERAALRELREETGWRAADPALLGSPVYEAADWATQCFTVVAAHAIYRGPAELERSELGAVTRLVDPAAIAGLVRRGHICDAATLAALAVWNLHGGPGDPGNPRTSKDEGESACES